METKTVTNYRRPVCVSKSKIYPCVPAINECDNDPMDLQLNADYRNTPIYYRVEVQVKFIFWRAIWGESTDENNTDQLGIIRHRAEKVAASIESEQ